MTLNREYIRTTLEEEKLWKTGEADTFTHGNWTLTLRREEPKYEPYRFSVTGRKEGTMETIARRYHTMSDAFLHILNHFNENVNVRDKYTSLDDYLDEEQVKSDRE